MTPSHLRRLRYGLPTVLGLAALTLWLGLTREASRAVARERDQRGEVEFQVKSNYSTIRVRKVNNVRTLGFVRDSGEEVVESMVDLDRPYELLVDYTRYMFMSYLIRPRQEKVLIVGLGGGSMVNFLRHYDPKVKIDVVEIDPVIVRIADQYFGIRSGAGVSVLTTDGAEYLKKSDAQYDVIYMDAFLKPSRETDETGVPVRLKTIRFYKEVQKRLKPDGLVMFNLNPHSSIVGDVKTIRDAFPQTYIFRLPNFEGLVVAGSMTQKRMSPSALVAAATELDRRFQASYSFQEMLQRQGQ